MAFHKFKVWWPARGQYLEISRTITAVDHRHAATIWAGWYDVHSADFSIVGGEVAKVKVLREDEVQPRSILVSGVTRRQYRAEEALPL